MSDPGPENQLDIPLFTLRALFVTSAMGLGLYLARVAENDTMQFPAMIVAGLIAFLIVVVDLAAVSKSSIATVSAIVFGLLIGFLAAQLFIGIVSLMGDFDTPEGKLVLNGLRLALTLIFCYLGPAYILRTKDDFRFIVPYVEFRRQGRGPVPLILDTSAIIDGRVIDLAQARLFDAPFVVSRDVVEELQRIADSSDKNRRVRGRRGLDRLQDLQGIAGVEVEFPKTIFGDQEAEVDRRLIELTQARAGKLVTVDANLQKVCELEGVPVLNLHEVTHALKPPYLPGDPMTVQIVKPGEGPAQGVGYLDDGTMVVVEGARELKGQEVTAVVTRSLQSSVGRMIFAKHLHEEPAKPDPDDDPKSESEPKLAAAEDPA